MIEPIRYGEMPTEKLAAENEICRNIVREISRFGVTQRQQMIIIYLLALELEDVDKMQELTAAVREIGGKELFLIDRTSEDV